VRTAEFQNVSVKRSLWLQACGAGIGLALAGYSLFTARGTSTLIVPAEDVALVNQQPISRSDYLAQITTLYDVDFAHATAEQRHRVLDDMIREELFVQRGKELDLAATDSEVRAALVNAVELEIASDALTSQPTEAALRTYFNSHQARYASEGTMILQDLLNGSDTRKVNGEEFYFAAKIHLGDRLFEAARQLNDGESAMPIPMADGTHVLRMVRNMRPVPFDFATARERVLADFRNGAINHSKSGEEVFLRKRANVLIAVDLQ
jgi:SurA N-terminal domain